MNGALFQGYSSAEGVVVLGAAEDVEGAVAIAFPAGGGVGAPDRSGHVLWGVEVGFFANVGEPCVGDAVAIFGVGIVVAVGRAYDTASYLHGVEVG